MRVLATLHLADLGREPRMILPTKNDWAKIPRFLAGTWPKPVPPRSILTPNNHMGMAAIDALSRTPERDGPYDYTVIDTEYGWDDKVLSTIGVGVRRGDTFSGWQAMDWQRLKPWQRDLVTAFLQDTMAHSKRVLFQNTMADVPVLVKAGVLSREAALALLAKVDDTMLAHAILWSEWPHRLEFLASMYSELEKLKHLSETDPALYNWGDVCDTDAAWLAIKHELAAEPWSERIYREESLRLLPTLLKAKWRGIRIHRSRVESAAVDLASELEKAQHLATAHCGWPLDLGSTGGASAKRKAGDVAWYLYESASMPVQFKRGARWKKDKKVTVDADAIASLRALVQPIPDFESEERDGLSFDAALARCELGADPVLEARVVFAAARQSLSHYIEPAVEALSIDGRFRPDFLIHAQANARWSTNDPPLAQLPEDLRDIVYPDDGFVWLGHDWDQIELRINAEQCNDLPTLEAFANGWDIHVLNMCDCFGYPYPPNRVKPWAQPENAEWIARLSFQGKDDARRVYAKRFVYRLDYGGDPANAGDIPGTQALGLNPSRLIQASQRYLAQHPAKAESRAQIAALARSKSIARSFDGRTRKLTGDASKKIRDAFDMPMQAGVSGHFNRTVLLIEAELPWLEWMYGMHDSHNWQCPEARAAETWPLYKKIVERDVVINGRTTKFPASWKQCCVAHKDCFKEVARAA